MLYDSWQCTFWVTGDFHDSLKLQIWLKSDNILHYTCSPKYVCIIDSSTKCFIPQQLCKGNLFLHFNTNTEHFYILKATCWSTTIQEERVVAFPWQQSLSEHTEVLHHTYISCLVITYPWPSRSGNNDEWTLASVAATVANNNPIIAKAQIEGLPRQKMDLI
jgi:hypothetical protein